MPRDSIVGLGIAVIVISSIAWVDLWRTIRQRIIIRKATRAEHTATSH
jgi:hypothetical protein